MRRKAIAVLCFHFLIVVSVLPAEEACGWGGLAFGRHEVGFQLIEATDLSRAYASQGRDLRIYLWYPADPSPAPPVRFGFYAGLAADDFGGSRHTIRIGKVSIDPALPVARGFDPAGLAALMNRKTDAKLDVDFAQGIFPLLVLGQGLYYESPVTHAILCEYLASHGYLVATCPLQGTYSRFVRLTGVDLETQVRDLEFALARALELPSADRDCIGLLGFDMGGMAALVLQMRNPAIRALATLDAGILFGHFSELPNSSPHYDEKKLEAPWLHLTQNRFIEERLQLLDEQSLFGRAVHSDRCLIGIEGADHVSFTSYALAGIERPVVSYWGPREPGEEELYRIVCLYLLRFMNGHLKGDTADLDFLTRDPALLGEAGARFVVRHAKGEPAPPAIDDIVRLLYEEGAAAACNRVRTAYETAADENPFTESIINWLGYKCLYNWGRSEAAVEFFTLNAELHPYSANVYDSLGEALRRRGDLRGAVDSYRKSLSLNPGNENARTQLEAMGVSLPAGEADSAPSSPVPRDP